MRRIVLFLVMMLAVLNVSAMSWAQTQTPTTITPIDLSDLSVTYTQNFDGNNNTDIPLASNGTTSSALPQGFAFAESGSAANSTYTVGTGSSGTGDTYSYGATGNADRAFGTLQSGTLIPSIGAVFRNNTSLTITQITITYDGEQYRLGTAGRADRLDFQYKVGGTTITETGFIDDNNLDFNSPITTGTVGAVSGSTTGITDTITGLSIAPNGTFAIRFTDFNATGADDGLAIDNFKLSAVGAASGNPTIVTSTSDLGDFGKVGVGSTSAEKSYTVSGSNLTGDITITAPAQYEISTTSGSGFGSTLTLPQSGGNVPTTTIFVRFAPTATGPASGSITNSSPGATTQNVAVSGTGVAAEPTTHASNVNVTNPTTNSLTVNFTPGNGANRLVVARSGSAVTADPVDGTTYTANAAFGSGSQIGTGNYVVYSGTGNSVTVTNLAPGTTYFFSVYEFNGSGGTENYLTPGDSASGTTSAPANPPMVVISQVYGGGGNSGATYSNDFVELYNTGTSAVNLAGFSIQYAPAGPSGAFGSNSNTITILSGTIQPGQYFLVQEASGGANGTALPTPDATGPTNLSATTGKVALVRNSTIITGPTDANVVDFVGYGTGNTTANDYEGAGPAPAIDATHSDIRNANASPPNPDTNNNSADFTSITPPTPRNASTATFVTLISFTATRYSRVLWLNWQTGYEVDNLGFNVYREVKGKKVRLNGTALIAGAALQMGTHDGFNYAWPDALYPGAKYWLEDVDTSGKSTWHGPITPRPGKGTGASQRRSSLLGGTLTLK